MLGAVAAREWRRVRWTGVMQEMTTAACRRILQRNRARQKAAAFEEEKRRIAADNEMWNEERRILLEWDSSRLAMRETP